MHPTNLIAAITNCWQKSETKTSRWLGTRNRLVGEDFITTFICSEFGRNIEVASKAKRFELAFRADLRHQSDEIESRDAIRIVDDLGYFSKRLVARVKRHNARVEGRTGGDFGLIFTLPRLQYDGGNMLSFTTERSGILCQAKRRYENGSWGKATKLQKQLLARYQGFSAFYLFDIPPKPARLSGSMFRWETGSDFSPASWKKQLGNSPCHSSPTSVDSAAFIRRLSCSEIGTKDPSILDSLIDLSSAPTFEIEVYWSGGTPDPIQCIDCNEDIKEHVEIRLFL